MNASENVILHFYTCFANKDIKGMQDCYADNATFKDPAFGELNAVQVRKMWEMLIKSGKDMRVEFSNITADEYDGTTNEYSGTAEWTAWYTFSVTGNKVINRIKASFLISDGKIIRHHDDFSFYKWARQALGFPGLLLGWTPFLKNKIHKKATHNLRLYMAANS